MEFYKEEVHHVEQMLTRSLDDHITNKTCPFRLQFIRAPCLQLVDLILERRSGQLCSFSAEARGSVKPYIDRDLLS